jgi:hypothetical protein
MAFNFKLAAAFFGFFGFLKKNACASRPVKRRECQHYAAKTEAAGSA